MLVINVFVDYAALDNVKDNDGSIPDVYTHFEELSCICINKNFEQYLETRNLPNGFLIGNNSRLDNNGNKWKLSKYEAIKTDHPEYEGFFLFFYAPDFVNDVCSSLQSDRISSTS